MKDQFPQNGNYIETMRKHEVKVSTIVYALRKLFYGFQMVSPFSETVNMVYEWFTHHVN